MVLAEMLTGDSLLDATVAAGGPGGTLPSRISGMMLNEGLAIGTAVQPHRRIAITQVVAEEQEAELGRPDEGRDPQQVARKCGAEGKRVSEHRKLGVNAKNKKNKQN